MRILLTNDDGIDAPGMVALYRAAESLGSIVVVAPDGPRSGSGHAVTTHEPLRVIPVREDWYALGGTPADCSRLALTTLGKFDWVFSGINRGGNLGADTYISGTVAAAREAVFLGTPSIAVSQYVRRGIELDWDRTVELAARVIRDLLARQLGPRAFWNVNLPHLDPGVPDPDLVFCGLDLCPLDVRFRIENGLNGTPTTATYVGDYHGRRRDPGRDVEVCFSGRIAATRIPLEITP